MDSDTTQVGFDPQMFPIFEEHRSAMQIGINVSWFSGSHANNIVPFINQLKGARPWDDPSNSGKMVYDENGYPLTVPGHYVVSQLLIRSSELQGVPPHTGAFRLYGQGTGMFSLISSVEGDLTSQVNTNRLPREDINGTRYWYIDITFNLNEGELGQLKMLIHKLKTDDHIRDLALVHQTHLAAFHAGETFSPELVADLQGYSTLRLMDWMRANKIEEDGDGWGKVGSNWTSPNPDQRYISPDFFSFNNHAGNKLNEGRFEVSAPIEHIVALANKVDSDPWINLPVDITNARVRKMADYVSAQLEPELTPRWEYGNELFNTTRGFEGYPYILRQARATFRGFSEEGPSAAAEWGAYRGPQVYQIIKDVFDSEDRTARFVAPGWAFSGSLKPSGALSNGYLVRYFNARESRKMNDGTPLPLEVVTDYAVGMYYGGTLADGWPDAGIPYHILNTVVGEEAQAETLSDWLMFGAEPEKLVELNHTHLKQPLTQVPWEEDLDIAVTPLIWADLESGLAPLTDLGSLFRLRGKSLQYRGVRASKWTEVLTFTSEPNKSLTEMLGSRNLVGYGGKLHGRVYTGVRSSLVESARMRIDAHSGYAKALGLNFVAYEGGSHVSYPVKGGFPMYDAFNTSLAGAQVFTQWLEEMSQGGVDEYVHFMSHNRTSGNDWWGLQDYVGQDIATKPEALALFQTRAAYDPDYQPAPRGPLSRASRIETSLTGDLIAQMPVEWLANDDWIVGPDSSTFEENGSISQLRLKNQLPIQSGSVYSLRLAARLNGTASTQMRVVVRALGGGSTELLNWRGTITDGKQLKFDLGTIKTGRKSLEIVIQRVGQDRGGRLTISKASVERQPSDK